MDWVELSGSASSPKRPRTPPRLKAYTRSVSAGTRRLKVLNLLHTTLPFATLSLTLQRCVKGGEMHVR